MLWRLAWAWNLLEEPDSALGPALRAWSERPQSELYLGEYLRALYRLGRFREILDLEPLLRDGSGGYCRYVMARAERELGLPRVSTQALLQLLASDRDSVAADAALWLSILLETELEPDSLLALALLAAGPGPPGSDMPSTRLADAYMEMGMLGEASALLSAIRLSGCCGYHYWVCASELARRELDHERRIWACRRAVECRRVPATLRSLAWALYSGGRAALRDGDLALALSRLREVSSIPEAPDDIALEADSLAALVEAFASPGS